MNRPPTRRKLSPGEADIVAESRKLDAEMFALLQAHQIDGNQRDAAGRYLTEARRLAQMGHIDQAQQMVTRVARRIAQWRERSSDDHA